MKAVLPALNGPVTTILTVCIIAPRLMSRFRDPVNSGACLAPRLPEATGCDACPSGAPPASADFARPPREGSVFGGSGRLSLRPPETGHLDRPDAADQPLHERRLFRLVDGRQLARLGREGDLLDQLLVFLQLAGALHDDVLEVQAQGDAVLRGEDVVVEAEMAFVPGEQAVDAGQQVLADAGPAFLLRQVTGLYHQQT